MHGRQQRPATKRGKGYDYLHVAVDDHSRVAFVQVHPDEKGSTCARFITDAFACFAELGINVERVMTDNAKNYTVSAAFQAALRDRRHKTTRPYRPQTNGKAERFNRTLLEEWAYARVFNHNDERTDTLNDWLHDDNWTRAHSALGESPTRQQAPVNNLTGNYS